MKYINLVWRNALWILGGVLALLLICPEMSEIRAILFLLAVEASALGLSAMAIHAYTELDFIKEKSEILLGAVFLGVHTCVGLTVLGVYIAQFTR